MPFRSFGPLEIGLILLILLMVFGVGKLPQVGDAMGKSIRAFRRGQSGNDDESVSSSEVASVDAGGNRATRNSKQVTAKGKKKA